MQFTSLAFLVIQSLIGWDGGIIQNAKVNLGQLCAQVGQRFYDDVNELPWQLILQETGGRGLIFQSALCVSWRNMFLAHKDQ